MSKKPSFLRMRAMASLRVNEQILLENSYITNTKWSKYRQDYAAKVISHLNGRSNPEEATHGSGAMTRRRRRARDGDVTGAPAAGSSPHRRPGAFTALFTVIFIIVSHFHDFSFPIYEGNPTANNFEQNQ